MSIHWCLSKVKNRKNNEIDELKKELHSLRKDYDVEIKAMFLDLNRVKEELQVVKQNNGEFICNLDLLI